MLSHAEIRLWICDVLPIVQIVSRVLGLLSFPFFWLVSKARGRLLPADLSWQEAILFLLVCVKFFFFFFLLSTSPCLCVYAVTWWSLHVHWSIKSCRYRQQDSGTIPGVWQPLTLSLHLMTVLLCQPLVFRYFTTHTDCDCVPLCRTSLPQTPGKLSSVEFCKVRLANSHLRRGLCTCWCWLHTYLEAEDSCVFILSTPTETFVF